MYGIKGLGNSNIAQWIFSEVNGKITDEICIVENKSLSDQESTIIENYLESQFDLLTNSALNDKQKIEIISYYLAPNCYDTFMLDNWMKYFEIFLNKFKRKSIC